MEERDGLTEKEMIVKEEESDGVTEERVGGNYGMGCREDGGGRSGTHVFLFLRAGRDGLTGRERERERERNDDKRGGTELWESGREGRCWMGCREEGGGWTGTSVSLFPCAGFTMVLMQC